MGLVNKWWCHFVLRGESLCFIRVAKQGGSVRGYLLGLQYGGTDGVYVLGDGVAGCLVALVDLGDHLVEALASTPGHEFQQRAAHLVQALHLGLVFLDLLKQSLGDETREGGKRKSLEFGSFQCIVCDEMTSSVLCVLLFVIADCIICAN